MTNLIRIYLSFVDEKGHFINKAYDLTPEEFYKLDSAVDSFAIKRLGVFINKSTIKGSEPVYEAELREEIKKAEEDSLRYSENTGLFKPVEIFLSEKGKKILKQKDTLLLNTQNSIKQLETSRKKK